MYGTVGLSNGAQDYPHSSYLIPGLAGTLVVPVLVLIHGVLVLVTDKRLDEGPFQPGGKQQAPKSSLLISVGEPGGNLTNTWGTTPVPQHTGCQHMCPTEWRF